MSDSESDGGNDESDDSGVVEFHRHESTVSLVGDRRHEWLTSDCMVHLPDWR